jgi:DNA polymerase III gamma/tau subunit
MPTLIENEAIPDELLMELAGSGSREMVAILLNSPRARENPGVVEALSGNEYVTPAELKALQGGTAGPDAAVSPAPAAEEVPQQAEQVQKEAGPAAVLEEFEVLPETEAALQAFVQENAAEIEAAESKPFELVKEEESGAETAPAAGAEETAHAEAQSEGAAQAAAAATSFVQQDETEAAEEKKLTALQKISKLNVGQRIKLGFVGGKEERAILIRDTARLVQNAVLNSPKLSDPEVETYAAAKNLQENVFREIARQRRFLKLYPVVRNLVNNPRCPLDISLTLIKTLLIYDLKSLRHNKNVPDTIRKVAAKLYTEKASRGGAKKE